MAAIVTAQAGVWSATTTWEGGIIPSEGDTVTIGHNVEIDQDIIIGDDTTTPAIAFSPGGVLYVPNTASADYTLILKGDMNTTNGEFRVGDSITSPLPSTRKFTLKGNYSATPEAEKYTILNYGKFLLYGSAPTVLKTKPSTDIAAGATTIITQDVTEWSVGDEIVITQTDVYSADHSEKRTISSISGNEITVDVAFNYNHSTEATIFNLTRNIKVQAYDSAYKWRIESQTVEKEDFYFQGVQLKDFTEGIYFNREKAGIIKKTTMENSDRPLYCSNIYGTIDVESFYSYKQGFYGLYLNLCKNMVWKDIILTSCDEYPMYYSKSHNFKIDGLIISSSPGGQWDVSSGGCIEVENFEVWALNYGLRCYGAGFIKLKKGKIKNCKYSFLPTYGGVNLLELEEVETAGATTADFGFSARPGTIVCESCKFQSSSFGGDSIQNAFYKSSLISSNHNQMIGALKGWCQAGRFERTGTGLDDATLSPNGNSCIRLEPRFGDIPFVYGDLERWGVACNGGELTTVKVQVKKNAAYGSVNRPKIRLSGCGITPVEAVMSDVVDTWEQLVVSATPTRDGILKIEFIVQSSGTNAYAYFGDWEVIYG